MSNYDYEKEPQGAESFFELKKDKRTRRFLEAIKDLKNPKILEVGMGQGRFLKKVSEFRPDAMLYGIDISKIAIDIARNDKFLKGIFTIGDAEKIPFQDNFFDAVVIMDVLEHLKDPERSILEAKRVLASSGIFHFFVPCEGQPFTLDCFLRKTNFLGLRNFTKVNFGHIQYFSHADIKKLVSPYFSEIEVSYSVHWVSQALHILTLYVPKKIISFFGNNIQVKSRDAYGQELKNGLVDNSLFVLKKIWLLFLLPVSIVYEIEALILKNFSFTAQGLHFTGRKIYKSNFNNYETS